jgi:hypothetical protein
MTYSQRVVQFVSRFFVGTPIQRRHARYQLWMQCRKIDLRWNSVADLGLDPARSESHGNSGGPGLEQVLESLTITPQDAVLDLGAGKGGAMITLAKWPFARIDGVEISPAMIGIGRRNLEKLGKVRGAIMQGDAAEFTDMDPYTFFYMYNPFLAPVMEKVLANIRASLVRKPRKATLIYMNPVCHDMVVAAGFKQTGRFQDILPEFRVYTAEAAFQVKSPQVRSSAASSSSSSSSSPELSESLSSRMTS